MEAGSLDRLAGGPDHLTVDGGGGTRCTPVGTSIGPRGKDVVSWAGMFETGSLWLGTFESMVLDDTGSCSCIRGDGRAAMGDGRMS
jgi:hypothetical protein